MVEFEALDIDGVEYLILDRSFIDGEEYPSLNGTGTEDYFGGAWSFATQENGRTVENTYCTPFMGYPYYSNRDTLVHNDYHNDDKIIVRLVTDIPPENHKIQTAKPTLEDLYLYVFEKGK